MACQFDKNKKLLKKLKEKVKQSKLMKKKIIPTETCDLDTMIKTHKVKPSIKTIANMKIKRDNILNKMRKEKIVQTRREKFNK